MIRQATSIVAAALLLSAPAASGGVDPLRCESIALRKDGQRYECLGRCERRHAWRAARLSTADTGWSACREACEARYQAAMQQLDGRDICTAPDPRPDPRRCRSRLLRIEASRLVCRSQCGQRDWPGGGDCGRDCDAHCASAAERVLAQEFCAGWSSGPTCLEAE